MAQQPLSLASHSNSEKFWSGGYYELNLSMDNLREKQWARVLDLIWTYPGIRGPQSQRYVPNVDAGAPVKIIVPPPTTTLAQYGQVDLVGLTVGFGVQATRSLFECISVMIPVGMFEGITGAGDVAARRADFAAVDAWLVDLALRVYDEVGFRLAVLGYDRECLLPAELRNDAELRQALVSTGSALVQEDIVRILKPEPSAYKPVRRDLYLLQAQEQAKP